MRVLFCDPLNTQNSFYLCAKYLRQKGVDAHVVLGSDSTVPREHLPSWHDPESSDPGWIHYLHLPYFIPYRSPVKYLTRLLELVRFAREFDLIACSGLAPIWMRWTGKPFIFFSYGSDLDQVAVHGWSGDPAQSISAGQKALYFLLKHHMVGSLRKARATVLAPYQIETAKQVGLKNLRFMPHVIDTQLFSPMSDQQRQQERDVLHRRLDCDFILFHPPRHVWTDRSAPDCKGNDKVFTAFAMFVSGYGKRAKLIVARKGWDADKSAELADRLGISSRVVWIDQVAKPEMVKLYNAADVVLDQFVAGVLALVAVEAMACGTPTISYVTKAPRGMFYAEMPPIVQAYSEADISHSLCGLARDEGRRRQLGVEGRVWVEKYCSPEATIPEYISFFEQVVREERR